MIERERFALKGRPEHDQQAACVAAVCCVHAASALWRASHERGHTGGTAVVSLACGAHLRVHAGEAGAQRGAGGVSQGQPCANVEVQVLCKGARRDHLSARRQQLPWQPPTAARTWPPPRRRGRRTRQSRRFAGRPRLRARPARACLHASDGVSGLHSRTSLAVHTAPQNNPARTSRAQRRRAQARAEVWARTRATNQQLCAVGAHAASRLCFRWAARHGTTASSQRPGTEQSRRRGKILNI